MEARIKPAKQYQSKQQKPIDGFVKAPSKKSSKPAWPLASQIHQRTEKAQTLMRGGLRKPAPASQPKSHTHTAKPKIETQLRAKTTPLHHRVKHFGNPIKSASQTSFKPANREALSGELVNSARTNSYTQNSSAAAAEPLPSMVTSVSHQKLERLLDEALTKADSHKQAMRYHAARHFWQRRWFSGPRKWAFISCIVILLLAGFLFAWQRVPQLSMRVAGFQAHLSPVVPTYKPDSFALASPASAKSGVVTIKYKSSASPSQTYSISQSESDINSSMVAQNVVPKGTSVQTSQVSGNTVYIYGAENDAVWVNNNILYKVDNNAKLSSDQVLNIVRGLNP